MAALSKREWSRRSTRRRRLLTLLMKRDGSCCRYCGVEVFRNFDNIRPTPLNSATIEHWPVPKRCLPVETWFEIERCILACFACNLRQERIGGMMPLDYPGIEYLRAGGEI